MLLQFHKSSQPPEHVSGSLTNMVEEGTELEKVPLSKGTKSDHDTHQSSLPEIVVLDEDSRPSTSGKSVQAINWGDRKVSPDDLEVRDAPTLPYSLSKC